MQSALSKIKCKFEICTELKELKKKKVLQAYWWVSSRKLVILNIKQFLWNELILNFEFN